ncbi:sensor histidine kinase [Azospirillum halopraeferens]|uniref:sensor histidine kinase n=1 Tax=Azospirillum halopraeferens TaxID=34010 RepID=UPI0003F6E0DC|nr:MEDS domain-containing protein [Azospirillum halopraeferens]
MESWTDTGIEAVGRVRWGSHFCQFYDTSTDLTDILVPYFKAGLEQDEQCLWVVAPDLSVDGAVAVLRNAVPDLDARMNLGRIDFIDQRAWYHEGSLDTSLHGWLAREREALDRGRRGLRLTGNVLPRRLADWDGFIDYETRVSDHFAGRRIVGLCTYCLGACQPTDVLDVVGIHQFAVARRHAAWQVIESASVKQAKEELRLLNAELEERVLEQTAELRRALENKDVLFREVHHRVKNNLQVVCSLLILKAGRLADGAARQMVDEMVERIRAMSLVHEALYQRDDSARIDFGAYLRTLVEGLQRTYGTGDRVRLRVDAAAGCALDLDAAIPAGLITTEVVSNALKHAFPAGRSGTVTITFARDDDGASRLTVRDDGPGLPGAEPSAAGAGLGLVRALAAQLHGRTAFHSDGGAVFELVFPA